MHATAHTTRGAWRISAAATQIKTRVDFAHNSFVDDTYVTANEVSAQIARAGLFTAHDRLGFGLSLPLAIRGGAIRQQTPRGYTADGGYNIVREEMALRVQSRHRAFHVDYQVDRPDLTRWFVAASVHDNWGNQRGRRNVMLHAGLMAPL